MGANSSRARAPPSSVGGDQNSALGASAGVDRFKQEDPIHCLCALGETSILSGGTGMVSVLIFSMWY